MSEARPRGQIGADLQSTVDPTGEEMRKRLLEMLLHPSSNGS